MNSCSLKICDTLFCIISIGSENSNSYPNQHRTAKSIKRYISLLKVHVIFRAEKLISRLFLLYQFKQYCLVAMIRSVLIVLFTQSEVAVIKND